MGRRFCGIRGSCPTSTKKSWGAIPPLSGRPVQPRKVSQITKAASLVGMASLFDLDVLVGGHRANALESPVQQRSPAYGVLRRCFRSHDPDAAGGGVASAPIGISPNCLWSHCASRRPPLESTSFVSSPPRISPIRTPTILVRQYRVYPQSSKVNGVVCSQKEVTEGLHSAGPTYP
jgi:hypothetical protein